MKAWRCSGCEAKRVDVGLGVYLACRCGPTCIVPAGSDAWSAERWGARPATGAEVEAEAVRLATEVLGLRKRTRNQHTALLRLQRAYDARAVRDQKARGIIAMREEGLLLPAVRLPEKVEA